MLLSLIIAVIMSVVAVFFANDNQSTAQIQFFGLHLEAKLGIMIVSAFGIGAIVGVVMMLPAYLVQGWALIRSRRKMEDLQRDTRSNLPADTKQV